MVLIQVNFWLITEYLYCGGGDIYVYWLIYGNHYNPPLVSLENALNLLIAICFNLNKSVES